MPDRIPALRTDEILRVLLKLGFQPKRKKGSHLILAMGGRRVVVPIHAGRDVPKGTLLNILKQAGVTKKEFLELVR